MIDSQLIIERSIYKSILVQCILRKHSLDPDKYLPISLENSKRYEADKAAIIKDSPPFIHLFGASTNLSRGNKVLPRITIDPQGFYPGDIGLVKAILDRDTITGNYVISEFPYETIHQHIDVRIEAANQEDLRLLQSIIMASIPQRGYIKPYIYDTVPFTGNIYVELANFANAVDLEEGILGKVYQFEIKDTLLEPPIIKDSVIVPIVDISILINDDNITVKN